MEYLDILTAVFVVLKHHGYIDWGLDCRRLAVSRRPSPSAPARRTLVHLDKRDLFGFQSQADAFCARIEKRALNHDGKAQAVIANIRAELSKRRKRC